MSSMGSPGGGFFGQMMGSGAPTAFTSPPINPQALSALAALMQQGQGGPQAAQAGLPQPGQTPNGQPSPQALAALNPGGTPAVAAPAAGNPQLMMALAQLSKLPPDQAKAILARIGFGGPRQPAMSTPPIVGQQ